MLRQDLVVKAYYDGGVVETVTNYTLSGTLEVGTSTITASYKGESDSFDVTVESSINYIYKWDLTQSLTDQKQGVVATLGGNATFAQGVGVSISDATSYIILSSDGVIGGGLTLEIDFSGMSKQFGDDKNGLTINTSGSLIGVRFVPSSNGWRAYRGSLRTYTQTSDNASVFSAKTLKMVVDYISTGIPSMKMYANDTLIYDGQSYFNGSTLESLRIGSNVQSFYDMTITGVRIYETPQGGN